MGRQTVVCGFQLCGYHHHGYCHHGHHHHGFPLSPAEEDDGLYEPPPPAVPLPPRAQDRMNKMESPTHALQREGGREEGRKGGGEKRGGRREEDKTSCKREGGGKSKS